MKSKIIQISTVVLDTIHLYALCEDGTIWYCQPVNTTDDNKFNWYELKK